MMKVFLWLVFFVSCHGIFAQDANKWLQRDNAVRSKGRPVVSAWHTGTAGIIKNDGAELSLFNTSRVGMTEKTELLFRIGEEWVLPNVGVKHRWWGNDRFALSSEHHLYYTWPLLKILQKTGIKDLVSDTVPIKQGIAMRHELLFSWLINPQNSGCPDPAAEKILTVRAGVEFYAGQNNKAIQPFNRFHTLYHTQIFQNKLLYYGGLQFDSYFSRAFHYSVNALYYNVGFSKDFAAEGNLRITYYVSRRIGISASCKAAYMKIPEWQMAEAFNGNAAVAGYMTKSQVAVLPLLDITYLIRPDRGEIQHGLFKNRKKMR